MTAERTSVSHFVLSGEGKKGIKKMCSKTGRGTLGGLKASGKLGGPMKRAIQAAPPFVSFCCTLPYCGVGLLAVSDMLLMVPNRASWGSQSLSQDHEHPFGILACSMKFIPGHGRRRLARCALLNPEFNPALSHFSPLQHHVPASIFFLGPA